MCILECRLCCFVVLGGMALMSVLVLILLALRLIVCGVALQHDLHRMRKEGAIATVNSLLRQYDPIGRMHFIFLMVSLKRNSAMPMAQRIKCLAD